MYYGPLAAQDSVVPIGLYSDESPLRRSAADGPFCQHPAVIAALRARPKRVEQCQIHSARDILQLQEHPVGEHWALWRRRSTVARCASMNWFSCYLPSITLKTAISPSPAWNYRLGPYPDLAEKFGMS